MHLYICFLLILGLDAFLWTHYIILFSRKMCLIIKFIHNFLLPTLLFSICLYSILTNSGVCIRFHKIYEFRNNNRVVRNATIRRLCHSSIIVDILVSAIRKLDVLNLMTLNSIPTGKLISLTRYSV